jgi:EmrB/QacA subfamily drug resistance transporter
VSEHGEHRAGWATLTLVCLAQFMVILDVSIVNVALPSIRSDLGFSEVHLQWVVNAYTITFAGFLLLGGRMCDVLGRRRVFIGGLLLFAGASLVGGLSQSQEMLIGARAAQGLGGAVVSPATLAILTTSFSEGAERNRALGVWGAMGGAGGAAGALLGGILTDALSWQWILFVNVPIGVGAALLAPRLVEEGRNPRAGRGFDLAGAFTVTAGLVALVFGIVRTEEYGWGSAQALVPMLAGLALIALFLVIEGRLAKAPLMPLRIFASRMLTGANLVVFLLGASMFGMWYFVSLYLQQVLGYTPIEAGLAFLPMTISIILGSAFASRGVTRFGAKPLLVTGMTLQAIGLFLFTRISVGGDYLSDILLPSLVTAIGLGLAFVPVTIAAVAGVKRTEAGLASGLVNTSRQMGGALGLAILATVAASTTRDEVSRATPQAEALTDGFHHAFALGAGFAIAGALVALLVLPRVRPPRSPAPVPEPAPESP